MAREGAGKEAKLSYASHGAQALRGGFERTVGSRLCGNFWTLRESEVAEVIGLIESGDRVT